MSKNSVIVYASTHHGNTFKLVKAIEERFRVDLVDACSEEIKDLSEYDLIGFASGIDFGKFYSSVEAFADKNLPAEKSVFFLYTCAMDRKGFTDSMKEIALNKGCEILGEYGCKGYNTYGPWKLIGGMNKKHPSEQEVAEALDFYESLIG